MLHRRPRAADWLGTPAFLRNNVGMGGSKDGGTDDGMAATVTVLVTGRVGLFIRLPGLPGARPAVLDALHTYADRLAEEPGTELFTVSIDPSDDDVVWLTEWFRDEDALEAHRAAPAFADLLTAMGELLNGPAGILRLDPLRLDLAEALATGASAAGASGTGGTGETGAPGEIAL